MKKAQMKRGLHGHAKPKDLLKPFDFCCDINHQDPDTRYDTRIPPFVTSLTNIAPKTAEGPDLKFRVEDIGKPTVATLRSGTHKSIGKSIGKGIIKSINKGIGKGKSQTTIGRRGRSGRGPLRWYLEDEIALARDIIANEKAEKRKKARKHQHELSKAKKRRRSKKRKSHKVADENPGNEEDPKDIDEEDPKDIVEEA